MNQSTEDKITFHSWTLVLAWEPVWEVNVFNRNSTRFHFHFLLLTLAGF